jgi:hypothetical protein
MQVRSPEARGGVDVSAARTAYPSIAARENGGNVGCRDGVPGQDASVCGVEGHALVRSIGRIAPSINARA